MSLYAKLQRHLPVGPLLRPLPGDDKTRSVLLICDDALGDLLAMSGVIRYLQENGYAVTLVMRDTWQAVAPFLWADRFIYVNMSAYKGSLRYRLQILNEVRKQRYVWAAASLLLSGVGADILRYCGAKERWACRQSKKWEWVKFRRLFFVNKVVRMLPYKESKTIHTDITQMLAHYYAAIMHLKISSADIAPVLNTAGYTPDFPSEVGQKYMCFVSDTTAVIRQYSCEKLVPLLESYARQHHLKVIVTARKFNPSISDTESVVNMTGKTSLQQLVQLIFHAQAVIGNETGATHLAWMLHKPTIMLCGGGHFGLFRPPAVCQVLSHPMPCFGCSWEGCFSAQRPAPCISGITAAQIQQALERLPI